LNIQKKVEVYLDKKRNTRQIDVVQYSTGIQLVFVLMDFIAPEGTTATLYVQKPSGHIVYQEDNITVSSGIVTVDLENQAIVECGKVIYQLTLVNGEDEITTFASIMNVEKNYADSNAVESTTVISAFKKVTEEQIAKIQAKAEETLATIPDDYTDIYNATVELSQIKAPVIVQKASGNPILLTDSASSKVFDFKAYGKSKQKQYSGKNLLKSSNTTYNSYGITLTPNVDDGTYKIVGTTTQAVSFSLGAVTLKAGNYILNGFITDRTSVGYIYFYLNGSPIISSFKETPFTITEETTINVNCTLTTNTTYNDTIYPMIRLADIEDDTYEPYVGGVTSPNPDYPQEIISVGDSGTLEVKSCRKNLFQNTVTSRTANGVEGTLHEDGTFTLNGDCTYQTNFTLGEFTFKANHKYIMNGSPVGGSTSTFLFYAYGRPNNVYTQKTDYGQGVEIKFTEDTTLTILLSAYAGASLDNVVFKPMIRRAEVIDDTYEPYKENVTYIPLTEPLRSVGEVKDEIVKQDGVWGVLRRIANVVIDENSTMSLGTYQGYNRFSVTLASKYASVSPFDEGYCTHMRYSKDVLVASTDDNTISIYTSNNGTSVRAYFRMDKFATVDELKTWLTDNPITVEYELATEIFEPFEDQTQFNQLSVFNPIAYIIATDEADMDLEYAVDTKTYIDNKFAELSAVLLNN